MASESPVDPFRLLNGGGNRFTKRKWDKTALGCIISATTAVDALCREIVTTYSSLEPYEDNISKFTKYMIFLYF